MLAANEKYFIYEHVYDFVNMFLYYFILNSGNSTEIYINVIIFEVRKVNT